MNARRRIGIKAIRAIASGMVLAALCASSTASLAQAKPLKLRIGVTQTAATAPATLAEIYGTYKEQGLDVEVVSFRGAVELISAGVGGSLNLMATGVEQPAFLAARKAEPWKDIVAILGRSAFSIVVQPDKKITPGDFKAIKGWTMGIPGLGRPAHSVVKSLLKDAGLNPETDVTYVEQPSGPPGIVAWEQKRADIAVVNEPVTSTLLERKTAKMFVDLRAGKHGPLSLVPQATVLAPVALIKSERATLERFVTAICKAAKRGRENPKEAATLLAQKWGAETKGTEADALVAGIVATAPAWTVEIPRAPVEAWFKVLVEANALKQMPKYEEVVDTSFSRFWSC